MLLKGIITKFLKLLLSLLIRKERQLSGSMEMYTYLNHGFKSDGTLEG